MLQVINADRAESVLKTNRFSEERREMLKAASAFDSREENNPVQVVLYLRK
jgi:hypothetical protein